MSEMCSQSTDPSVDDLIAENKRLLNELLISNICVKTFLNYKSFIDLISNQIIDVLDPKMKTTFRKISQEVDKICLQRSSLLGNEVDGEELVGRKAHERSSQPIDSTEDIGLNRSTQSTSQTEDFASASDGSDRTSVASKLSPKTKSKKSTKSSFKSSRSSGSKKSRKNSRYFGKAMACDHPGCNFVASYPSFLKRHKEYHCDERKYNCHVFGCNKAFKTRDNLDIHMKHVHKAVKARTIRRRSRISRKTAAENSSRSQAELQSSDSGSDRINDQINSLNEDLREDNENVEYYSSEENPLVIDE